MLLYATGGRPGEIAALEAGDVEIRQQAVYITLGRHPGNSKTGPRTLRLEGWVARMVCDHVAPVSGPRVRLTVGSTRLRAAQKAACVQARVPDFDLKGWRRLACQRLMDARLDPPRYEAWMGHSYDTGRAWYRQVEAEELEGVAALLRPPAGELIVLPDRAQKGGE